jgi:hypothetical protein
MHRSWAWVPALAVSACFIKPDPPVIADARGDSAVPLPPCSQMRMFVDPLDGPLDPAWRFYNSAPGTNPLPAIVNGGLEVHLNAPDTYAQTDYHRYYDLRDDSFTIEVNAVAHTISTDIELRLTAEDASRRLVIVLDDNHLIFRIHEGQMMSEVRGILYDRTAHRFWRIARSGDTITWSTSPDGASFTDHGSATAPWATFVMLTITTLRSATPAGGDVTIRYEAINPGRPAGDACPASQLRDGFGDDRLDGIWARTVTGGQCTIAEAAGRLGLTTAPGGGFCWVRSSTFYDLRDQAFEIEVAALTNVDGDRDVFIEVRTPADEGFRVRQRASALEVVRTTGASISSRPYSTGDRWWRLRGDTALDRIVVETATDGVGYTLATTVSQLPFDRLDIWFGVDGDPVQAAFDNVNSP